MLIVDHLAETTPEVLIGKERDAVVMTAEQRQWPRQRLKSTAAREIALALPTGTALTPGAVIAIGSDWYIEIEAAPEPVLAVCPRDRDSAVRIAFEIGNHHFPLAIDGAEILVPDDTAMEHLFKRLGIVWERRHAVFNPIARGHSHDR
jgi:urease accessory protein